jgi:hypothetical protein
MVHILAIQLWPITITLPCNHIWFRFKKLVLFERKQLSSLDVFFLQTDAYQLKKNTSRLCNDHVPGVSAGVPILCQTCYVISNILLNLNHIF